MTSMTTSSSSINLEAAAHEAALADGIISSSLSDNSKINDTISKTKKAGLRRGKWTAEEESYANRLISEFKMGLLPLTDGTTLRTFLSKLLNCDPMRISKKFVGGNCIGKQVFRRRVGELENLTGEQIERSRKELADLERKFLERVAQTNRSKTGGGGVVKSKEGKGGGYGDEEGTLAPWMMPPEDPQYSTLEVISTQPTSSGTYQQQSPRGSYKIRLPQYQNGETGGQIQNDGTLAPHNSNGGSSSMAALYGFPPYQSQYQGQDSHMNMSSNQNNMTGNGGGSGVDYSSACNMNMSSLSGNIGQGQNPNSINHNNVGSSDGQSMNPGYSLPTGIPMGGSNNGQSALGAINGGYNNISSLGRINSLDVLCSLDIIKFPSPQSMDGLSMYGQIGEDAFPWSSNPGAGTNSGQYMPPLAYRSSLSQSNNSFSRSSLWPSMNNLVNAAEAVSNCEALGESDRGSSGLTRMGELGSLNSMVNIHKQFGGTGLGSMLSLDGIDCNAVYASEVEEERESAREKQFDSANELRSEGESGSQDGSGSGSGHKHPQSIGLNPQSIGFSLDGRLSGVTSAVALRVSEIERASSSTPALDSVNIKIETPCEASSTREEGQSPRPVLSPRGNGTTPTNAVLCISNNASMAPHGLETGSGSGLPAPLPLVNNDGQIIGMKSEIFAVSSSNGHSYTSQMSISSHSAALIPSSSGYGNVPVSAHYHPNNVVPTPLSQPQHMHMMQHQQQQYEQAQIAQKYHLAMPRNSSVENFWMLVDMGDLPQPDNNVLSETLWNSEGNSGSSIPHAAMSAYHGAMPIGVGRPPGQKIYRGKGAKQLAAEMEAGELARAAGQEKDHDTALAEGPSGPLTGPHGGVGAGVVLAKGFDKISNFNADTNMYDTKSEDVSGSVSMSISYRSSQTSSPTMSLPAPVRLEALPAPLEISGVISKGENQMNLESDEQKEATCNSPSSTSGPAASAESQSKATESDEEAMETTDGDGDAGADTDADAAGGQYPVEGSEQTAVSAAEEVEVEQSDSGQNKVNERAKRKFDDLDIVHSKDVSSRRDVTMEKKSVSELDEVGTEFSTLHTAERSINLFREI